MKALRALFLSLLLACPAWAAGEIQFDDPELTGQTLYVVVKNAAGNALTTGTTFATYTTTRGDFDQAMTEVGVTGLFTYSFPALAAGTYSWTVYQRAGGSPSHTDDIAIGAGAGYWNGTVFGDAAAVAAASSANTVSAFLVAKDHSWRFDRANQVMAPNLIVEVSGFDDLLLEMDFSGALSNNASINSISSVTVTDETGKTEPTVVSSARRADAKAVHIKTDGASASTLSSGYTYNVTIVTTDNQTITRKGRLAVQ